MTPSGQHSTLACLRATLRRLAAVLLVVSAGAAEPGTPAAPFIHRATARGTTYTVSAAGLTDISLDNRRVASGNWHAEDASWLSTPGGTPEMAESAPEQRLTVVAANRAQVSQTTKTLAVSYDYTFTDEDVVVRARVENRRSDRTLAAILFRGLTFSFSGKPDGFWRTWDAKTLQRLVTDRRGLHPSFDTPLGGCYVVAEGIGLGLAPLYPELEPTLFWWPGGTELCYVVKAPVPPGGARVFSFALRVSANRDWKHLLAPYRDQFRRLYGPVQYRADSRPFAQYNAADEAHRDAAANPYGFNWYRFDLAEYASPQGARGLKDFTRGVAAALAQAQGQGVLIWSLGGYNPRGCNFRPDMDVLPPEIQANLPLFRELAKGGYRLGALARPGQIVTPASWHQDTLVQLAADEPSQVAAAGARFKKNVSEGFTCFYLDSFGTTAGDALAMRAWRGDLGPDIQTFSEFWTDVSLVYSGAYMELDIDPVSGKYRECWGRLPMWEIMRWLLPGVGAVATTSRAEASLAKMARIHTVKRLPEGWVEIRRTAKPTEPADTPAERVPSPFRFLIQNGIAPMFYFGTRSTDSMATELGRLSQEGARAREPSPAPTATRPQKE